MNNLWFNMLKKQVDNDYKQFKKMQIDKTISKQLDKNKHYYNMIIVNNKIISKIPKNDFGDRVLSLHNVFKLAIKYSKNNNLTPINGTFYMNRGDSYNFQYNYPTFSYAKPMNKKGFLIPDFNFLKYKQKLKKFNNYCNNNKINEIYFKGSSTSIKRSMIREKMVSLEKPFNIEINDNYKPFYNLCNYKYVLDLCGVKPWSVRLVELFMSKSFPIRVVFYNTEWNEQKWVQFYEQMFQPWTSYIEISYNFNYEQTISDKIINNIEKRCLKIFKVVNENNSYYKTVTENNYKKINSLTTEHIGYYLYNCCMSYSKLLKND